MKKMLMLLAGLLISLSSFAQASHSVALACTDTDPAVTQYHFFRSTVSGVAGTQLDVLNTKITACAFTDSTVAAGNTYYYTAQAQNILGDVSVKSNEVKAVLPAVPAAPTGLTVTIQ